jgi:hypothetical protein
MILYLLIGVLFQWLMHYATIKISSEYVFNHKERIALIFIWPIGLIFFIYSFIKTFFFGK